MKPLNSSLVIGIIGCGHLGSAFARALVVNGFPATNLRLSHGGNPETLAALKAEYMEGCITSNIDIFARSDVVFITLRPDQIRLLQGIPVKPYCLVVSCVAGVECAALKQLLGVDVIRLMPSSPQSMETKTGIAALYPANEVAGDLLFDLDIETVVLDTEKQLHFFTALVCLPAAYLQLSALGLDRQKVDLKSFSGYNFDKASRVIKWAGESIPGHLSGDEVVAYISRMATKGGITEAIVGSLRNGADINSALLSGVRRGEEIAGKP